jgi:hypothetical protein
METTYYVILKTVGGQTTTMRNDLTGQAIRFDDASLAQHCAARLNARRHVPNISYTVVDRMPEPERY